MKKKSLIYTDNLLDTTFAKTAHGLIRGTDRYDVVGVVDTKLFGNEAGLVLDGVDRGIPIFESISSALSSVDADIFILGVASIGGLITDKLRFVFLDALDQGLDIVSGLHSFLSDDDEISLRAKSVGKSIIDVRKVKKANELHFWSGEITKVTVPRVAVLGTDCALGKRTTAKILIDKLNDLDVKASMIYTGQTGWLQGWKFGFILDATPNDFVCGELEHAVISCIENDNPEIIFIEGQSSLRNPSGPCGAEFILAAGAEYVILQTAPNRKFFSGLEELMYTQHSLKSEIDLIEAYGAKVIAISINVEGMSPEEILSVQESYIKEFNIQVFSPISGELTDFVNFITTKIVPNGLKKKVDQ